jgi:hypothetical protein
MVVYLLCGCSFFILRAWLLFNASPAFISFNTFSFSFVNVDYFVTGLVQSCDGRGGLARINGTSHCRNIPRE